MENAVTPNLVDWIAIRCRQFGREKTQREVFSACDVRFVSWENGLISLLAMVVAHSFLLFDFRDPRGAVQRLNQNGQFFR